MCPEHALRRLGGNCCTSPACLLNHKVSWRKSLHISYQLAEAER
ncbi:hypothetical protein PROFUN_15075 [Planoprotostelium fungivorum]|uniref:Uncharacterized protein n=1 Tax=Planoprotostelium fungivorum TaxID=1890364 RepID=A0A2P6MTC0_9EUKA|nr:hypothetical protein PROFUN_15075 [Planoprotostelium fungivorum]